VKTLWETDAALGERIDSDMREASLRSERAVLASGGEGRIEELAAAIRLARSCFDRWGLASGEMGSHLRFLEENGALAVKPTGSGDGGFALSLWQSFPPRSILSQLIPLGK
jgi:mevalonate kinase